MTKSKEVSTVALSTISKGSLSKLLDEGRSVHVTDAGVNSPLISKVGDNYNFTSFDGRIMSDDDRRVAGLAIALDAGYIPGSWTNSKGQSF